MAGSDIYFSKTDFTYFWGRIKNLFVKAEAGKGLSTEDYTTAEKTKLSGITDGAEPNTIESISMNGTPVTPDANKNVALTADENVIESISMNGTPVTPDANKNVALTADENIIESITVNGTAVTPDANKNVSITIPTGTQFTKVQTLPATGETGYIYLVPTSESDPDAYDEYFWDADNSKWERLGPHKVDLSNNWDQTNLVAMTTAEIDTVLNS